MTSRKKVSFVNYKNQIKNPFVIYLQFESLQIPGITTRSASRIVHKPCGFAYSVKCSYDKRFSKYEDYIGEDSPKILWKKIEKEVANISQIMKTPVVASGFLNDEEKRLFNKIQKCYFCLEELGEERYADFHPLTRDFLGAAHQKCKNNSKLNYTIPVVVQNLKKYGLHFLRSGLPQNEKDKYDKFNFGLSKKINEYFSVKFIDSKSFLDEKIEELEAILDDKDKFKLRSEFKELFPLVKKKVYFPLFYVDSFEKLQETSLPKMEGFFDQLHDENISKDNYNRCLAIWKKFKCETISDYFLIFLKTSVFLLEDIFEKFRNLCFDKYHLDLTSYYTIAGFSWDSLLKYTKVKLELLEDKEMNEFIRPNIRGGINHCSKRHAKANNIYCENYEKSKPNTFIIYLDANNLGGWAMSQKLPFSNFAWMTSNEIQMIQDKILELDDDGDRGFIFEVDLVYPKKLHKLHNDLPFCMDVLEIEVYEKRKEKKSAANFYPKRKYVIEFRTLKQCLQNGLKLTKIHRVLTYKQRKWMEPYISYNTQLRIRAKNDFELKLYKLLNNSVFGKTIQKDSVDKPICSGFSILELSKKFMYDFHFKMLEKFPNANLLYIDTDGAIYEVETYDYFDDIRNDEKFLDLLDTSNLDPDREIPPKNKKKIGKMKDECDGKIIHEFFGVGSKVYYLNVDGVEIKKAAGVKKYIKNKTISRNDYRNCVLNDEKIIRSVMETTAVHNIVQSKKYTKVVLSPGDKKRYIMPDKIQTLALGYGN